MTRTIVTTLVTLTIIISSCDNFKNDTPEETAKYILMSLQKDDETRIRRLIVDGTDSLNTPNEKVRRQIHKLYSDTSRSNKYKRKFLKSFKNTLKTGKEIGVNWSDVEFLRFDFEIEELKNEEQESISGKIIFKSSNKEFHLKVDQILKFNDGWKNVDFDDLVDIVQYKKEIAERPYKPYELSFTSSNWEYKYISPTTFSNFYVTFKNSTQDNFDYIKYKVTILTKKNGYNTEVFSRTVEQNQNIYAGDVLRFEVLELRDFYIGVNIADEDTFSWHAEVIDVRPHPKRLEVF